MPDNISYEHSIWKMLIILIPYKSGAKSGAYYDTYLLGVACNEKYNGGIF